MGRVEYLEGLVAQLRAERKIVDKVVENQRKELRILQSLYNDEVQAHSRYEIRTRYYMMKYDSDMNEFNEAFKKAHKI